MTSLFANVRAVLFDMDGTLVETNIDFSLMRQEMFRLAQRYDVPESDVESLDILAIVDHVAGHLVQLGRSAEAASLRKEAFDILEQIEMVNVYDSKGIPGAVALMEELGDAGVRTAIVTRNCRRAVEISLSLAGIVSDVLLTRDDVRRAKPHPDHLLQALAALDVPSSKAVMVGDHWMDIRAGKDAGTRTIGLLRPDRPSDFFDREPPDLIITDLTELLGRFQRFDK